MGLFHLFVFVFNFFTYKVSGIYMYIWDKGTNIEITNMTIICIISLLLIISLYKLFKQ